MLENKSCDLLIYGADPGGVSCAIRAARHGLNVILVSHTPVVGGMLTNGLCVWDTRYEGYKAPIFNELRTAIFDFYREEYGKNSSQFRACKPRPTGHYAGTFEPHVVQNIIEKLVIRENNITCIFDSIPTDIEIVGRSITKIDLKNRHNEHSIAIQPIFTVDASYEGDLMALAGCNYTIGRESRQSTKEPYAGRVFMKDNGKYDNSERELENKLCLRGIPRHQQEIQTTVSGSGDHRIQAYNYRLALTDDPNRQIPAVKPPNYNPENYLDWKTNWDVPSLSKNSDIPNRKWWLNRPQLPDLHYKYPDSDWEERQHIMNAHWEALLGYLYFLQTDARVPDQVQHTMRLLGLPKDEFSENGGRPWEIYVREARRLKGQYTFSAHDVFMNPLIQRAPLHSDTIAITDWYVDVHACSSEIQGNSLQDGVLKLHSQSVPGQIPFGSLLPQELDNLAVINCLSSTHLGFSAVRVEPTWMAVGEAVGCAAFLAKQDGVLFANLDRRKLVFELARQRLPISYFEDLDCGSSEPWLTAVQGLSAFGFFPGYYSYPTSPLTDITLRLWIRAAHDLRKSYSVESADDIARRLSEQLVREAPSELNSQPLTNSAIALITQEELLPTDFSHIISTESKVVHRGRFCHLLMKYILSKDFS